MRKNSSMSNTIIFLSLLLILLSMMLKINVVIKYRLLENKVYIILKVYGIRVFTIKLDVIGLFYEINDNKKIRKLSDIFSIENNYLILEIKKNILDKLYYARFDFSCDGGLGNVADTTILMSSINLICYDMSQYLDYKDIDFKYSTMPIYEYVDFKLSLDILVYFTLFDMIFALILSFYRRRIYVKKTKRQRIKSR